MPTKEIQKESLIDEDVTPYRGRWVVVRDGRIITSGLTPGQLQSGMQDGDYLVLIPSQADGTLVL
jgi:hypothetical protein